MKFIKLSSNAETLLNEIVVAKNATQLLNDKFDNLSSKEENDLRTVVGQLIEADYISVMWANNKPYQVFIKDSAKTYNERLEEYEEKKKKVSSTIINDNSINIGKGNNIKNSKIISGNNQIHTSEMKNKETFTDKHPVLVSILVSLIIGLVLMFSFWSELIHWIEGVF